MAALAVQVIALAPWCFVVFCMVGRLGSVYVPVHALKLPFSKSSEKIWVNAGAYENVICKLNVQLSPETFVPFEAVFLFRFFPESSAALTTVYSSQA